MINFKIPIHVWYDKRGEALVLYQENPNETPFWNHSYGAGWWSFNGENWFTWDHPRSYGEMYFYVGDL